MTNDELIAMFREQMMRTRGIVAVNVGAPVLLAIEGLGYTVVPSWVVEMFEKVVTNSGKDPSK